MPRNRLAPHLKSLLLQSVLAALLIAGLFWLFTTTQENLARLGVQSGFDFLGEKASFSISQTLIEYGSESTLSRAVLVAMLNTAVLVLATIALATGVGVTIGVARIAPNGLIARLALAYVETFRNIPVLLQIFFWYYVVLRSLPPVAESYVLSGGIVLNRRGMYLPEPEFGAGAAGLLVLWIAAAGLLLLLRRIAERSAAIAQRRALISWTIVGAAVTLSALAIACNDSILVVSQPAAGRFNYAGGMRVMPELLAVWIGLSLYNASYIAEIVRSGFLSVPQGQTEAARALGLGFVQTIRLVKLPLALRVIIPPLTTVYLAIFKSSSLGAAIAYPEIVSVLVGTISNLVGQPLEIMAIVLLLYVPVSLFISFLMNRYNRRSQPER